MVQLHKPYGDPKNKGLCGAPACRCTPLVLALCVALTGLVTVGAGSCIASFMWHDDTPKALGLALVALGIVMLCAGLVLFVFGTFSRSPFFNWGRTGANYQYPRQDASRPQANVVTPNQATTIITNVQAMPSTSVNQRSEAPPAYDSVLDSDVRYTDNRQQAGRATYASRELRLTATSAV